MKETGEERERGERSYKLTVGLGIKTEKFCKSDG
jgi:hypothetical protein